jgi:hypothetical protein
VLFLFVLCWFRILFRIFLALFFFLQSYNESTDGTHITALYKDPSKVPNSVMELMRSQHVGSGAFVLQDYDRMTPIELLGVLTKIAQNAGEPAQPLSSYALTADNLLKMVLVVSFW